MIEIRRIKEADVGGFRKALDSVCRERKYLAAFEAPAMESVAAFVRGNIENDQPQFVAATGEQILGWCDAIPGQVGEGTAHVGRLGMGVIRDFRGQGIGTQLLEATIAGARSAGLEKIELSVYAANQPAVAIYRNFGFVEEGRKIRGRLVDGVYDDVLLFSLIL